MQNNYFFQRLFELAPQAVGMFPKFRNVPINELEDNEYYRAHALQVVEAVGLAISFLDELNELKTVLRDLGSVHCKNELQDAHFDVSLNLQLILLITLHLLLAFLL